MQNWDFLNSYYKMNLDIKKNIQNIQYSITFWEVRNSHSQEDPWVYVSDDLPLYSLVGHKSTATFRLF